MYACKDVTFHVFDVFNDLCLDVSLEINIT